MKNALTKIDGEYRQLNETPEFLSENDTAIITFTRANTEVYDGELTFAISVNGTQPYAEAMIAEGTYTIDGMLMGEKNPALYAGFLFNLRGITDVNLSPDDLNDLRNNYGIDDPAKYNLSADEIAELEEDATNGTMQFNTPIGGIFFGYINETDSGNPIIFTRSQIKNGNEITIYLLELKDLNITDVNDMTAYTNINELTRIYQYQNLTPYIR